MSRQLVLPSRPVTLSAPGIMSLRGSMASLHAPLPTLRLVPRGTLRTARGRCDSLGLHRSGLAPPTPCRSPDALPASGIIDSSGSPVMAGLDDGTVGLIAGAQKRYALVAARDAVSPVTPKQAACARRPGS